MEIFSRYYLKAVYSLVMTVGLPHLKTRGPEGPEALTGSP